MDLDKILTEVTAEISDQKFLKVSKGTEKERTYTFSDRKRSLSSLRNKLEDEYGNKIVKAIMGIVGKHLESEDANIINIKVLNGTVEDTTDLDFDMEESMKETNSLIEETLNVLNEVSAEVVKNIIPFNKIFDASGKVIPKEKLQGSETAKVLNNILGAMKKQNLIDKFSPDNASTLDISAGSKGSYDLIDDEGNKYTFKVATGKITKNA